MGGLRVNSWPIIAETALFGAPKWHFRHNRYVIVNPDASGLDFPGGSQGLKQGGWPGRGRLHCVINVGRTGKFDGRDYRAIGRDSNRAQRLRGAEVNLPTSNQIMDSPNTFIEPLGFSCRLHVLGIFASRGENLDTKLPRISCTTMKLHLLSKRTITN